MDTTNAPAGTPPTGSPLVDADAVAGALGLTSKTVRRMALRGDLPSVRASGDGGRRTWRFDPHAVVEALTRDDATRQRLLDAMTGRALGESPDAVATEFRRVLERLPVDEELRTLPGDARVDVVVTPARRWFRTDGRVYGLDGPGVWRFDGLEAVRFIDGRRVFGARIPREVEAVLHAANTN